MEPVTTRRPRSREAPDVRRAQILGAADRVFLAGGLSSATMDDVAREAGIAKGTIYLYFPSKDALVQALQAQLIGRVEIRARRLLEVTSGTFAAQLERFVSGVVDDLLDYPDLQHLALHDVPRHGALDEVHDLVATFMERGRVSGELRVSDPGIAAWFLVDGVLGVLADATHDPRPGKRLVRQAVLEASCRAVGVTDERSAPKILTDSH